MTLARGTELAGPGTATTSCARCARPSSRSCRSANAGSFCCARAAEGSRAPSCSATAIPGPGPREPISTGGGESPLWSRDGKELFFTTRDQLLAVDVTTAPVFSASAPRVVFEGRYRDTVNGNTPFSVSADGQRFLRVQQVQPDRAVTHIDLVLDWLGELQRAMPPQR